nr:MAG TPA: hypothetical protein [Herelleviridae sp.]
MILATIREINMAHQVQAYPLRLPPALRDWLSEKAAENMRSLNGEIAHRLEESRKKEAERENA